MHGRTSVLSALAQPRRAASTAADLVVAHRALDGAVLSIEGAPTYAHAISTGAVPVFCAFQRAQPDLAWWRDRVAVRVLATTIPGLCSGDGTQSM